MLYVEVHLHDVYRDCGSSSTKEPETEKIHLYDIEQEVSQSDPETIVSRVTTEMKLGEVFSSDSDVTGGRVLCSQGDTVTSDIGIASSIGASEITCNSTTLTRERIASRGRWGFGAYCDLETLCYTTSCPCCISPLLICLSFIFEGKRSYYCNVSVSSLGL